MDFANFPWELKILKSFSFVVYSVCSHGSCGQGLFDCMVKAMCA